MIGDRLLSERRLKTGPFASRERIEGILSAILVWAQAENAIRAMTVVGSHARGAARSDSDLDLVLLVIDPARFEAAGSWVNAIAWQGLGDIPVNCTREQYGILCSYRVRLKSGLDVEFGLAPLWWASLDPVDPRTPRVVEEGCRILYDPNA